MSSYPTITSIARGRGGSPIIAKQNPYDLTTGRHNWYLTLNSITVTNCPEVYFAVKISCSLVLSNSTTIWAANERADQPLEKHAEFEPLIVTRFYQPNPNPPQTGTRDIHVNLHFGQQHWLVNNPSEWATFYVTPIYVPRPGFPDDPAANVLLPSGEVIINYSLYKV